MRFFHKFGSINYKFLALVNGILLSAIEKKEFTKALSYFEKYKYVLNNIKIQETSDAYKNKIWQLWLQGEEHTPEIVKKCIASVRTYHGDSVVFLTKDNLDKYIKLPDYIEDKYKKGIISHAHYSDMVRLMLLAKYGGTWVDSTIYLTDTIPDDILQCEFCSLKSLHSENLKYIKNIQQFKLLCNHLNKFVDLESSYFISAKSGNILINAVLNLLLKYWKYENKLVDYLMIDKMFAIAILTNKDCYDLFVNMPNYYIENSLMLQNVLFEKFDRNLLENIKQITSIHKLTYKNLHRNPYNNSFLNRFLETE